MDGLALAVLMSRDEGAHLDLDLDLDRAAIPRRHTAPSEPLARPPASPDRPTACPVGAAGSPRTKGSRPALLQGRPANGSSPQPAQPAQPADE